MKELLDSDRVNFLVWRFLLESNYRETAAKFQKEWQVQAPHRQFDFAPHVKNYALVSVLNKGLVYEGLERDFIQPAQAPHDVPAKADSTQVGVFGPLVVQPPHQAGEDDDEDEEAEEFGPEVAEGLEISRKRQMERQQHPSLPNGSPAKRQRLSHGCENGPDSATDAMEIDQQADSTTTMNNNNNHAYPSPLEGEQAPSPVPRTDGPEQGTQIEKVHELSQETVFLRLTADEPAAETSPVRANQNPLVLHCEWNPRDPTLLAAAGTDALTRVWTVTSRPGASENVTDHVDGTAQRLFEDLVEDDLPRNSTVTAMAWATDGNAIAVANDVGGKTRVNIWGPDGTHVHRFDGAESPLLKLRWSPNNAFILGVAPDDGRTLVTLFSAVSSNSMSFVLHDHDLREEPLDTTWIGASEFVLCGGDHLSSLRFNEDGIVPHRQFNTRKYEHEHFVQVQFDWRSGLLATSSDKGNLDLWDESGQRRQINAHMNVITSLQWQPLQANPPDDERLLASGGEDGAIFLWNVRSPDNRPKYSMTMENPVVALAFTPDGAFIAGATSDRILIWKVGEHQIPRASWSRAPHPGWFSPKPANGDPVYEDIHCLCWDATGQKLAYGTNSRLAVINFR